MAWIGIEPMTSVLETLSFTTCPTRHIIIRLLQNMQQPMKHWILHYSVINIPLILVYDAIMAYDWDITE